jgi:hypothetical protein
MSGAEAYQDLSDVLDSYRMRRVTMMVKSKRPDEIVFHVLDSDAIYVRMIKYFPNNKRFKVYGKIKNNFNFFRKEYEAKCIDQMVDAILLED